MSPRYVLLAATVALSVPATAQATITHPAAPASAALAVLKRADFESGTLSDWKEVQRAAPDRIRVVRGFAAHGRYAGRFEVHSGDPDARAEVTWERSLAAEGQERLYSWQTYFPKDYPRSRRWQVTTQWKNEGTGSPPLKIEIHGNKLAISGGPQVGYRNLWRAPLVRGRWLRFVVRVKWSSHRRIGWISAWYEGRRVLHRRHLQTLYPGSRNYLKMGLYRDPSIRQAGVVYHDDLTVAAL